MPTAPLRFLLRYDPVFLDLGEKLAGGIYGKPTGAGASAVLRSYGDLPDLIAFFLAFFGIPARSEIFSDVDASLVRIILLYDGFALSLDAVVASAAVPAAERAVPIGAEGISIVGSVACGKALFEFRLGTERLLAFSDGEGRSERIELRSGDGERYRAEDLLEAGGPIVVGHAADARAREASAALLIKLPQGFEWTAHE